MRAAFLDPFAAKNNVQVRSEEGISAVTLAKLRQQKDDPQFDLVIMDRGVSDLAIREGLVEPIPVAALTNKDQVFEEALIKDKDGRITAVAMVYWAIGIAYNRNEIKQPPQSWLDLAKPEYKGKLGIYSPDNSIAVPLLVTLARLQGGGPDNMDPAFRMMAQLRDGAVFFGGSTAGANLLVTGEVAIATLASTEVWKAQDQGHPIEFAIPKEGVIAQDIRIHLVKGAKNREAAIKLVDYTLSLEAQQEITKRLLTSPANKNVKVAPELEKKLPWGAGGNISNLILVDANVILDNRERWIRRWNQEVAK
jgi:putative spermidine/putrescine transport system substrate-binding protein